MARNSTLFSYRNSLAARDRRENESFGSYFQYMSNMFGYHFWKMHSCHRKSKQYKIACLRVGASLYLLLCHATHLLSEPILPTGPPLPNSFHCQWARLSIVTWLWPPNILEVILFETHIFKFSCGKVVCRMPGWNRQIPFWVAFPYGVKPTSVERRYQGEGWKHNLLSNMGKY